ncbi:protein BPS1, chloroplastic [Lactuca sativa]|uniref:Uncharacterized protein n=1 Tax=Lactuca sativa TaxID=4236 RepID=A0A9R1WNH7_LACSA|nr:protein BPS1, chloroplastic [Lactuca sativa]KAJ0227353.1 hypothetical protein LSAT_V11C100040760 [Lactuca sativa]
MILQLNRLGFSHHNHHRNMSEASFASLQAFRLQVAGNLHRVMESFILGSGVLSIKWIHQCFRILPILNNEFAKLMGEIDYPVSSWEACSIEEYLDYTISMLELLNAISSSLSHLNQARVSLSHALSLMKNSPGFDVERLREITVHDSVKGIKGSEGNGERNRNEKEWIFHEGMMVLRSTGFWTCGVVLSGLKSDARPIMEIMGTGMVVDCSLIRFDSMFRKKITEERGLVKELEEVNETLRMIVLKGVGDSDAVIELKRRLDVIGNGVKGLKEEEEGLFAEFMAARNKVLETLRAKNK